MTHPSQTHLQTLSLTPLTMNGMFMMKCLAITDNSWQSIGIVIIGWL